jgi:5-methylcytosine-specific restriction endonuclease McrA
MKNSTCRFCGNPITSKYATVYCSADCYQQSRDANRRHNVCKCANCGKEFSDPKHPNRTYCSHKCFYEASKRDVVSTCLQCGKEFTAKPNRKQRFCSQTCSNRYHQPVTARKNCTCEECGTEFTTWNSRPGRFCSHLCMSRYAARQPKPTARNPDMHVTLKCVVCGTEYQTTTHQINNRGSSCCSRECANKKQSIVKRAAGNPNYRGGTVKYRGRNWHSQSREALKRDGYKCQICHKQLGKRGWDYGVHHIIPYRDFNGDYLIANELSNLITLCRRCHGKVEAGKLPCPRPLF